ncbi:uncharacterized protein LOC6729524 [Drosophila simulans]|uniref:GD18242 n=1 Tax=Drosophila simulans TaxID=7240 RepID=B4QU98_DROSI|nr:uncharacterized protein LOC6729524 [Drosophila simulans]EDX14335.1 GD18242 [Drosophila simulans]KMZ05748.1 uncharacterized protein Dsimw501_GD18242 [Drosophila simulans]
MGSIEKACISGFLCRLCSEMHRTVIHIYSDHGQRLCLVEKINGYLPITISPTDPLPKTICKSCLHRVEQHYSLLMRLTRMREERKFKLIKYKAQRNPSISSVESEEDVINSSSVHECPNRNEEDQATRRSESTSTAAETGPQTQESQTPIPKSRKTAVSRRKSSERHDASGAGPSNRHRKKETGTGNSETGSTTREGTHAD